MEWNGIKSVSSYTHARALSYLIFYSSKNWRVISSGLQTKGASLSSSPQFDAWLSLTLRTSMATAGAASEEAMACVDAQSAFVSRFKRTRGP